MKKKLIKSKAIKLASAILVSSALTYFVSACFNVESFLKPQDIKQNDGIDIQVASELEWDKTQQKFAIKYNLITSDFEGKVEFEFKKQNDDTKILRSVDVLKQTSRELIFLFDNINPNDILILNNIKLIKDDLTNLVDLKLHNIRTEYIANEIKLEFKDPQIINFENKTIIDLETTEESKNLSHLFTNKKAQLVYFDANEQIQYSNIVDLSNNMLFEIQTNKVIDLNILDDENNKIDFFETNINQINFKSNKTINFDLVVSYFENDKNELFLKFASNKLINSTLEYEIINKADLSSKQIKKILINDNETLDETFGLDYNQNYQIKILGVYVQNNKLTNYELNQTVFDIKTKTVEFGISTFSFKPISNQLSLIDLKFDFVFKNQILKLELIDDEDRVYLSQKTSLENKTLFYFENLKPNKVYRVSKVNVYDDLNQSSISNKYVFINNNQYQINTAQISTQIINDIALVTNNNQLSIATTFDNNLFTKVAQMVIVDSENNFYSSNKAIVENQNQATFVFDNLKPNKDYTVFDVKFFDNMNTVESIWYKYTKTNNTMFTSPKQSINFEILNNTLAYDQKTRNYSFSAFLNNQNSHLINKYLKISFIDNLNRVYVTNAVKVESDTVIFNTQLFKPNRNYTVNEISVFDDENNTIINQDFKFNVVATSITTPQIRIGFENINNIIQATNDKHFEFSFALTPSDIYGKYAEIEFHQLDANNEIINNFKYKSPRFLVQRNNTIFVDGLRKNNRYVVANINVYETSNTQNDNIPTSDFVYDFNNSYANTILVPTPLSVERMNRPPQTIEWSNENYWKLVWDMPSAVQATNFYLELEITDTTTNQIHRSHKVLKENNEAIFRFDNLEPHKSYQLTKINFYDSKTAINESEYILPFELARHNVSLTTSAQTVNVSAANTQITYLRNQRKYNFNLTLDRYINKYIVVTLYTLNSFYNMRETYRSQRVQITSDNINLLFNYLPSNTNIFLYGISIYDSQDSYSTSRAYNINTQAINDQVFLVKESDYVFNINQENRVVTTNESNTSHSFSYEIDTEPNTNFYLGFELAQYDPTNNQEIANTSFFSNKQLINANKQFNILGLKPDTSYVIKKALIYLNENDKENTGIVAKINNKPLVIKTLATNVLTARSFVERIYNQNQNDARSAAEFLANRTLQFSYASTLYELYGNQQRNRFKALSKAGTLGTSWIIDKDLSDIDNRTYYVATNIHVIANLRYPNVLTNSIKFARDHNNYQLISTDEFNILTTALQTGTNFELRYNGETPTTSFSNIMNHSLSLFNPNENGTWNNNEDLDTNPAQGVIVYRKAANFYSASNDTNDNEHKGFNYNPEVVNNISNPVYDRDNVESYELINPLLYDYYFKNYWNTELDGTPRQTLYKNTGIDFAVVKIKLKNVNNLPKAFAEYDRSPTLLGKLKTDDGKVSKKALSIYGYSGAERFSEANKKVLKTKNSLADSLVASRYFNESLLYFNEIDRRWYIRNASDWDYVAKSTHILKTKVNLNNTLDEAEGNVEVNDAIFKTRWYIKTSGRMGVFRGGSSGSGVIDSNKLIVGIFYASQDENDNVDNENDRDIQYFHKIWPEEDIYNPILYYINSRDESNSWLKRHWEAIKQLSV